MTDQHRSAADAETDETVPASELPAEPAVETDPEITDAEIVEPVENETVAESDLDVARRERDEYLELARRARAEFENFRKRSAGQAAEAERRGRIAVARELLPALDNLDRALAAAGIDSDRPSTVGEPPSEEVTARDALGEGVALVVRELRAGLERGGVHGFDPVGERFDPTLHEAIATAQAEGSDAGLVLETLEQGYRIEDHVIRPARVVVSG